MSQREPSTETEPQTPQFKTLMNERINFVLIPSEYNLRILL